MLELQRKVDTWRLPDTPETPNPFHTPLNFEAARAFYAHFNMNPDTPFPQLPWLNGDPTQLPTLKNIVEKGTEHANLYLTRAGLGHLAPNLLSLLNFNIGTHPLFTHPDKTNSKEADTKYTFGVSFARSELLIALGLMSGYQRGREPFRAEDPRIYESVANLGGIFLVPFIQLPEPGKVDPKSNILITVHSEEVPPYRVVNKLRAYVNSFHPLILNEMSFILGERPEETSQKIPRQILETYYEGMVSSFFESR